MAEMQFLGCVSEGYMGLQVLQHNPADRAQAGKIPAPHV